MTGRERLGVYFGDRGENPDEAYVDVARAPTLLGARRMLKRATRELGWDELTYDNQGQRTMPMHDHACDDPCPGDTCLGAECTYVDGETTHGPGCPSPCPQTTTCHYFEARA